MTKLYKLRGGLNWCPYRLIAKDGDLIWIENLTTNTRPLIKLRDFQTKDIECDNKKLTLGE